MDELQHKQNNAREAEGAGGGRRTQRNLPRVVGKRREMLLVRTKCGDPQKDSRRKMYQLKMQLRFQ